MSYRKVSSVRYRRLLDEGIVIQQAAGEVLALNATGLRVLELLDTGHSLEATVAQLAAEYDVLPATVAADVRAYAAELQAAGILEPGTP